MKSWGKDLDISEKSKCKGPKKRLSLCLFDKLRQAVAEFRKLTFSTGKDCSNPSTMKLFLWAEREEESCSGEGPCV